MTNVVRMKLPARGSRNRGTYVEDSEWPWSPSTEFLLQKFLCLTRDERLKPFYAQLLRSPGVPKTTQAQGRTVRSQTKWQAFADAEHHIARQALADRFRFTLVEAWHWARVMRSDEVFYEVMRYYKFY